MSDEKLPLIPHPGSGLAKVGPQGGRVLSEMMGGALALSRGAEDKKAPTMGELSALAAAHLAKQAAAKADSLTTAQLAGLVPRHRIGEHEFCEPDYRQILLWSKALEMRPEIVVERLLVEPKEESLRQYKTQFTNGRVIQLYMDLGLLPLLAFEWVEGLIIESLFLFKPDKSEQSWHTLSLPLSGLRFLCHENLGLKELDLSTVPQLIEIYCNDNQLTELDLSAVPKLTRLDCENNQLTELDLSAVPQLTWLWCENNKITELDLSAVPQLTQLFCHVNKLTELDLSTVPQLSELRCSDNPLTELDLSVVPKLTRLVCENNQLTDLNSSVVPCLTWLWCRNNRLTELDIRPLKYLEDFYYDKRETRLIQRPDQNF